MQNFTLGFLYLFLQADSNFKFHPLAPQSRKFIPVY